MRRVLLIGIGAGDPDHMTVQAIRALQSADLVLLADKGERAPELADVRRAIFERYVERPDVGLVEITDPPRDRTAADYADAVADWRRRRADAFTEALRDHLPDGGCGAFLVWGDPCLYDSMIATLDEVRAAGDLDVEIEVIPGITSVQALAARHRISLTRVGRPLQVTTGRRLGRDGMPAGVDDVIVMLDGRAAFADLPETSLDIFWGAYLGTPDEILVSGDLHAVDDEIQARRTEARVRKGWIMDTYLLRRREP